MKKTLLTAIALTLMLGGCVTVRVGVPESITVGKTTLTMSGLDGFNPLVVRRPDPHNPNVFVTANEGIVIDQEPVRPTRVVEGMVYIGWALDSTSDYVFPDNEAIRFTAGYDIPLPTGFACTLRMPRKKVIVCGYEKPARAARWKYEIRVADRNGKELSRLDPWVISD